MQVVAAVIERDGRILIGQRKRGARHSLKWEFPGGKVEPGEDPRDALARELREELAIEAHIAEEIDAYNVHYPNGPPIQLLFFRVVRFEGDPVNLAFEQIAWAEARSLADYDFLEGDLKFIRKLKSA
jgi:8-oxo-dGTP diphosphatase